MNLDPKISPRLIYKKKQQQWISLSKNNNNEIYKYNNMVILILKVRWNSLESLPKVIFHKNKGG